MIRIALLESLRQSLRRSPIVALLGPRQSGKTTLAREFVKPGKAEYFDLENPADQARLEAPMTALQSLRGTVVIDEIQRRPDLFEILRVLADRQPKPARFLILGSASPTLVKASSESLAGRVETIEMGGFQRTELVQDPSQRLWRRGGMPRSYLARSENDSWVWRQNYLQTFARRDLPALGMGSPSPEGMLRFLHMVAHYHGQIWNSADPARSLGVSEMTVRRWLDILTGAFLIRQVQPWHENLSKRQVKSPKVYWRDSGLLHGLLGLRTEKEILGHPKCGASWEGYVFENLLTACGPDQAYFWSTHSGAELDGLFIRGRHRIGIEIKRSDAPRKTPGMAIACQDLKLDHLYVVYPGEKTYALDAAMTVLPLETALQRGASLWRV